MSEYGTTRLVSDSIAEVIVSRWSPRGAWTVDLYDGRGYAMVTRHRTKREAAIAARAVANCAGGTLIELRDVAAEAIGRAA